jgi:L-ascorbate metabolism protein UlaG (beta-lactamase superfamily)
MQCTCRAFLILLLSAATVIADAAELKVRYIGNAAFEITDGKTTLLTDFPYQSGAFGYMTYRMADVTPGGDVACLITHRHKDHFESALLEGTKWKVIGPDEVLMEVPAGRRIHIERSARFGSALITPFRTDHAGTEHFSYLIEWNGKRVYFTGDTEITTELLSQKNLDIAFVTPWLLQSLDGNLPEARAVVIHHQAQEEKVDLCGRCLLPKQGQSISLPE